jgi:hypothetical protein
MADKCTKCGRTVSQTTADAKTLGLLQELHCGVYTCCQMAQWADEQRLAWFEATRAEGNRAVDATAGPEQSQAEALLVPVLVRRTQVPWYRSPDDRG